MKEAFKVILSAWSIVAIVLFVLWSSVADDVVQETASVYVFGWLFLLFAASAGIGWLVHRHREKEKR